MEFTEEENRWSVLHKGNKCGHIRKIGRAYVLFPSPYSSFLTSEQLREIADKMDALNKTVVPETEQ